MLKNLLQEYTEAVDKIGEVAATPHEFLDLCVLAVKLVDDDKTTGDERSEIAYTLAGGMGSILPPDLEMIRQSFLELEIPGNFDLVDDKDRLEWENLKRAINKLHDDTLLKQPRPHPDMPKELLFRMERLLTPTFNLEFISSRYAWGKLKELVDTAAKEVV